MVSCFTRRLARAFQCIQACSAYSGMSFPLPSDAAVVDESEAVAQQQRQQPLLLLPAPSDSSSAAAPSSSSSSLLIDALPYIDVEYNDPHMKAAVHALITQELQQSAGSVASFLSQLPELPALRALPSLQAGYVSPASVLSPLTSQHLAASFPSPPAALASPASGSAPPPPSSPSSLSSGVSYLLEDGLQHQLLRQYGPQQSVLISQHLRARKAEVQAEVEALRQRVEAVNRERKRRQDEVRDRLSFSEHDWWRLLHSAQTISHTIAHSGKA